MLNKHANTTSETLLLNESLKYNGGKKSVKYVFLISGNYNILYLWSEKSLKSIFHLRIVMNLILSKKNLYKMVIHEQTIMNCFKLLV